MALRQGGLRLLHTQSLQTSSALEQLRPWQTALHTTLLGGSSPTQQQEQKAPQQVQHNFQALLSAQVLAWQPSPSQQQLSGSMLAFSGLPPQQRQPQQCEALLAQLTQQQYPSWHHGVSSHALARFQHQQRYYRAPRDPFSSWQQTAHLAAMPQREQEDQQQQQGATAAAKPSSPKPSSKDNPPPSKDAQECDDALETYQKAKRNYANARYPSTYKTAWQRVSEASAALWAGTLTVLRWTASVPGKLWALRKKSTADWAESWKSMKKTVKHEAHHYWVGLKLLGYETRVASGLVMKAVNGNELTRRERRQLTRTSADLFRLVPMIIILVIPFMELALPVLLKLFPNMLPSTFEDKLKKEEEVKKRLTVKLEVARFLQDTVSEMAKDIKSKRTGAAAASADELYQFMNKVRAGVAIDNNEMIKFASLFNDELTLDNLDRVQVVSMCQFIGIPPYGTDTFLRSRLRAHLAKIKQDDLLIRQEGLHTLTKDELRQAMRARGMKALYGDGALEIMQQQMESWLDLHLSRGLPSSLLLLSRAFTITSGAQEAGERKRAQLDSVKETLLTLPEEVIKDVGLEVATPSSGTEELQKRLALIQKEQKLIKAENEQRKVETAVLAPAPAAGAGVAAATASPTPAQAVAAAEHVETHASQEEAQAALALAAATAVVNEAAAGAAREAADAAEGLSAEERAAMGAAVREKRMQDIITALAVLASNSGVAKERAQFMELVRGEIERLEDTLGRDSPQLRFTGGALHVVRPEDTDEEDRELEIPTRLENRVSGILHRIEKELDDADRQIGNKMHVIDLDNDGLISRDELVSALQFLREALDEHDLHALLDQLEIRSEGGAGQSLIPVAELMRLAEAAASDKGGGGDGKGKRRTTEGKEPKESVQIHTM